MHITLSQINDFEHLYRTHFVNSLSGYKSANLIGTQSKQGLVNLAIVSSVFHLGAHPPLMGTIFRPNSVARHSFENILSTGFYTINQVSTTFFKAAHQTSARYERECSEFEEVGLTPEFSDELNAPYVKESRLKIGMELVSTQTLAENGTELVIGKVIEVFVEEAAVKEDGFIDLDKLNTVAVSGLDRYHTGTALARLSYAKPFKPVTEIKV